MKHLTAIFTFTFLLHLSTSAAVPLKWTVETSRAQPATFEAYQGETLDFEATLQSYGKPLEAPVQYAFYWQTNGMGSAYWAKEVVVDSRSGRNEDDNSSLQLQLQTTTNVLFATWSPEMDVGAKAYNCFIGLSNSIYHAAFQLRLRPSPGAVPNELPLPQKVIDFSQVTVLNPPWSGGGGSGGVDTNAVIDIANATIATNATISGKRGKTDESVYCFSPWSMTPFQHGYEIRKHDGSDGFVIWAESLGEVSVVKGSADSTYLKWEADEWTLGYPVEATRTLEESLTHVIARRSTSAASALAKFDADGNIVADNSGKGLSTNDYEDEDKAEVAKVKDKADEFTEWDFGGSDKPSGTLSLDYSAAMFNLFINGVPSGTHSVAMSEDSVAIDWMIDDDGNQVDITATRKRVLRTGDAATPQELTDAISTNNPAFVSAVQSIAPSSPPSLRLYDEVRGCYWIGRMVNGVISWEVEE